MSKRPTTAERLLAIRDRAREIKTRDDSDRWQILTLADIVAELADLLFHERPFTERFVKKDEAA